MSIEMYCQLANCGTRAFGPIPEFSGWGYPTGENHEYCSMQIDLHDDVAAAIMRFAHSIPGDVLDEKGIENSPHTTVKYGLPTIPDDELQKFFEGVGEITMSFGRTSLFVVKDKYDVLKCDVASPGLRALNAKVVAAYPTIDLHSDYKPHLTVAYLRPGQGSQFVGKDPLAGMSYRAESVSYCNYSGDRNIFKLTGEQKSNDTQEPLEPLTVEQMNMSAQEFKIFEMSNSIVPATKNGNDLEWSEDNGRHYARGSHFNYIAHPASLGKFRLMGRHKRAGAISDLGLHLSAEKAKENAEKHDREVSQQTKKKLDRDERDRLPVKKMAIGAGVMGGGMKWKSSTPSLAGQAHRAVGSHFTYHARPSMTKRGSVRLKATHKHEGFGSGKGHTIDLGLHESSQHAKQAAEEHNREGAKHAAKLDYKGRGMPVTRSGARMSASGGIPKTGKRKKKKKHRGFAEVQGAIERKEGVSKEAAGAIVANAARKASPIAKAKNPCLKKVKMSGTFSHPHDYTMEAHKATRELLPKNSGHAARYSHTAYGYSRLAKNNAMIHPAEIKRLHDTAAKYHTKAADAHRNMNGSAHTIAAIKHEDAAKNHRKATTTQMSSSPGGDKVEDSHIRSEEFDHQANAEKIGAKHAGSVDRSVSRTRGYGGRLGQGGVATIPQHPLGSKATPAQSKKFHEDMAAHHTAARADHFKSSSMPRMNYYGHVGMARLHGDAAKYHQNAARAF